MIFGEKFRKKYALSAAGEANVKKGTFWTVITNLVVMAGIGILYLLMQGYMATLVEGAALPPALPLILRPGQPGGRNRLAENLKSLKSSPSFLHFPSAHDIM